MAVLTKQVRNALVYYDSDYPWRWYEAFGSGVNKYITHFVSLPVDATTHDPLEFTNTIVEAGSPPASTAEVTDYAGGALLITSSDAEDDGYKMQLGHAATGSGENFGFDAQYPFYFGCRMKVWNTTECDFLFGLAVTDTAVLNAVTDGLYFRKIDGLTTVRFVSEKDSLESTTPVIDALGDTEHVYEMYYDGATVYHYVDNRETGSINRNDPNFPNNELMRVTIEFLTGSADSRTMTVDWLTAISIRD